MGGEVMVSDVRWLAKLMRRIAERAARDPVHERVSFRFTTTEVKRAERIASKLGWHLQHFDIGRLATDAASPPRERHDDGIS